MRVSFDELFVIQLTIDDIWLPKVGLRAVTKLRLIHVNFSVCCWCASLITIDIFQWFISNRSQKMYRCSPSTTPIRMEMAVLFLEFLVVLFCYCSFVACDYLTIIIHFDVCFFIVCLYRIWKCSNNKRIIDGNHRWVSSIYGLTIDWALDIQLPPPPPSPQQQRCRRPQLICIEIDRIPFRRRIVAVFSV